MCRNNLSSHYHNYKIYKQTYNPQSIHVLNRSDKIRVSSYRFESAHDVKWLIRVHGLNVSIIPICFLQDKQCLLRHSLSYKKHIGMIETFSS